MALLEDAVRFGGMVLAHAAWIASQLEDGALVCPFAVIQTGNQREVVPFESDSQAESIERGKASFQDFSRKVDLWSFAREGLRSYPGSDETKVDVLTVTAWKRGLDEPIVLQQAFIPRATGKFKLLGSLDVSIHGMIPPEPMHSVLRTIALEGARQHPQGDSWTL
ncbi:hypothetical protein [Tunturibacter empetritectus]|uniref:Uncharacterized protein n=1 Tax=Tunturiibacter empetritectus TaxID=3069691 RepID=A0A7W8MPQ8_9BACT|nr:hypothetical protein [Edaphobacter lichenicola]MBB5315447.1 hypothetical protein [Edaphobacter lichenicola]